ncbi:aromatic acid/H+ symport family MFS transporter [Flavobacterium sp. NRK F10]|uniref:Aromatic acid/H+ symport family MFS transporter n=1 Tax=Flavobacterium sediminis TaxID=2201181 RepID=A0A2U8QU09_9FLAO|nr:MULTISPECIES: aromatic acid/H+ symport family MFS transporter [Flavobacterium]AWM13628.1 aromatic acid/H+ symport family MFS transporter [Flavobacterium sediminis]MCO6174750.1 aromatic acid/H+ symport family MFS transporter [Flavobacterium sp. NRK F10]
MRTINIQQVIDDARFGSFHWKVLFWCFLIIIFDVYDLVIYGVVLPILMKEWNLTPMEAGTLGSYALFGMMFGALIFGPLADKIGRKKSIIICLVLFSVFTLVSTLAVEPFQFGLSRFIAGLGIGGLMPNAVALITEYAPKKMRSLLTTIMFSGYAVGGMLSAGLGMLLLPSFGWQSVFYVGAIPLVLLPIILKYLPDSLGFLVRSGKNEEASKIVSKIDPNAIAANEKVTFETPEKVPGASLVQLFKNKRGISTVMFWIAFFMCLLMVYGLNSWLPKLMNQAGYPLGSSLSFLLALNVGAMIGAIGGGWLGDKFHLRKVLIIFLSLAAISLSLLGFKSNTFVLYLLIGMAGATTIGTQILLYAYVAQFYPMDIRSTGIGWASGVGRLGGMAGPILGGALLSMGLPFEANFMIFAIPGAIGALAICFVSLKYAYVNKVTSQVELQTEPKLG